MTPIADMVEQMLAEGIAASAIVLAIRTIEVTRYVTPLPDAVVLSSSPAAVKQRRYRENRKQNQHRAEANDAAAGGDESSISGSNALRNAVTQHCDLTSLSKKETTEEGSKKEVIARARGTRLSSEVPLSDADRKFAIDNGVSDPDALWAEFVDYWIGIPGQRGTKLNWSATWRNRVRAVSTRKGKSNGPTTPNRLANALGQLRQNIGETDRGEEGCGPPPRLLSHG